MDSKRQAIKPKLIVGLGNPDPDYTATRHNMGKNAARCLIVRHSAMASRHRGYESAVLELGGARILIVILDGYMNESGTALASLAAKKRIKPHEIVVIYDDLDLPLGSVRVRTNTSSGGHNGVQSIIDAFGSSDFVRVRIGIGPKVGDAKKFVLRPWSKNQQAAVAAAVKKTADAIELLLTEGLNKASAHYS